MEISEEGRNYSEDEIITFASCAGKNPQPFACGLQLT